MLPTKDEVKSTGFIISRGWFWLVVILLTGFAVTTGGYMARPYWLDLERKANVASPQYVEARRAELIELVIQVNGIDTSLANPAISAGLKNALRNQRAGLIQRMATAAAKLPTDAVPSSAIRLIATN